MSLGQKSAPKVSIVMPCYDVEKYLRRALDSVISQKLTDIEILPVDDGSPDACAEIIREYALRDDRIKPVYKKNGGYGSAVNAGLKIATGEYVAILEPDDYVAEDYYYVLYMEAFGDGLDVCGVNAYCEIREKTYPKLVQTHWVENPVYLSFEGTNEYFACGNVGITLKVYKRSFLKENDLFLNEDLRSYHDVEFVPRVLLKAEKIRIIIGSGYYYRKDVVTSSTKNVSRFVSIVDAVDVVVEFIKTDSSHKTRKAALVGYCLCQLIYYYHQCCERLKSVGVMEEILRRIESLLKLSPEIYISESKEKLLSRISSYEYSAKILKVGVIDFSSCPSFSFDYFKSEKQLHRLLSSFSFFSYYSFQTGRDKDIENFRECVLSVLYYFPDYSSITINDFVKRYLELSIFDYFKNYNQKWFVALCWYMYKNFDDSYLQYIYESFNDTRSDKSVIQGFPEISDVFSCNDCDLLDGMRKTKVLNFFMKSASEGFDKYISGKSIAIVGNAPCEVGLNRGSEIDSHDIVIRFNNYSTDSLYTCDYGEKVSVWSVTPGIENLNPRNEIYEYDYVISPKLALSLSCKRYSLLYNYIISGGNYFQFETMLCRYWSNITVPSVGFYTLFFLLSRVSKLGPIRLYGFSPTTAKNKNRHYFQGDPVPTSELEFHDWDSEEALLDGLRREFDLHNNRITV